MKLKKLILSMLLVAFPNVIFNLAFASTSASINTTGISEGVNAGANASFGSQNASRCGWRCGSCCVKAVLGYAQMAMSLMQMLQTMGGRDALSPGTDWANPGLVTDFGPISPADAPYLNPIMDAIRTGDYDAYVRARDKLNNLTQANLAKLAAEGYSYDLQNGTITTPQGTQSMDSLSALAKDGNVAAYEERLSKLFGLDTSGGGGKISADGSSSGGGDMSSLSSSRGLSSVDSFLNKLDKGQLDSNKLVGMSKNTKDGDAIGVAMGNLFKTIHVKYKSLSTQDAFK
jgi:hypothetical protein